MKLFGFFSVPSTVGFGCACLLWSALTAPCYGMEPPAVSAQLSEEALLDERCLREAYPEAVRGLEVEEASSPSPGSPRIWVLLTDGRRVLYQDARAEVRDADGALRDATVRQSLAEPYPLGQPVSEPPQGDPGRDRSTALLLALFGENREALQLQSVRLNNANGKNGELRVSGKHGMVQAMQRVAAKLEHLAAADPALRAVMFPLGGGYANRGIAGTTRRSAHALGIAVDLNPKKGAYWRWTSTRKTHYPQALVEAFEAEGFIWGGRWMHVDAMHFEYRPELICKARALR